jgi:hypothetical protein
MKAAAKTERTPPEFHHWVFACLRGAAVLQKEQRAHRAPRPAKSCRLLYLFEAAPLLPTLPLDASNAGTRLQATAF